MKKIKKFFAIFGVIIVLAGVLVVPLSAFAYDGDNPLYSNSLIGTTWKITKDFPAEVIDCEVFGVAHGLNFLGSGYNTIEFSSLLIGYSKNGSNGVSSDDNVFSCRYLSGSSFYTHSFAEGTDVLITFFSDPFFSSNYDLLLNFLLTYCELVYQTNNQFISFQTKVEHDYPTDDVDNFRVDISYKDMNAVGNGSLYTRLYINGTETIVNSIVMPPFYDEENDYYYYLLRVRYTGYIPSMASYKYDGTFVGRIEFDGQTDEIYIDAGDIFVFEGYTSESTSVGTDTLRLIIRDYYNSDTLRKDYDTGYSEGYDEGFTEGYEIGNSDGYNEGFDVASSQDFGKNLIGDTFNAPIDALNSMILFTSPNGVSVTLGGIFGAVIALCILIAFLKMFAGG